MGVLWVTGLSGSGKTTFSQEVIAQTPQFRWIHLDGDQLRPILANEQKYDQTSRHNLAMKYSKLASLISSQGHNVIVSTISLFKEIHEWNKTNINNYFEIFIEVDIQNLQKRNNREIYSTSFGHNVVGIDLEYNKPFDPNLIFKQNFDILFLKNNIKPMLEKIEWLTNQ
jgi:adenylylsulfate kinase-like enzyme